MSKQKIDLSNIKTNDLEETSSFYDLMSRSERLKRNQNINSSDDIEEMVNEKRKNTEELAKELEKAKEEYNKELKKLEKIEETKKIKKEIQNNEENLGKTQILELTRQMKFNFEEVKKENEKNTITFLNTVGILNLLCIGFYIYLLTFTNYQDNQNNYLIAGCFIILLVLLFGISVISNKKARKIFNILNILTILSFIAFNAYIIVY